MSTISIDPQARGWRDDGSVSGIQRVDIQRAGYVAMPFRRALYSAAAAGSANFPALSQAFPENDDGTHFGLFGSVAASASLANSATLSFFITGNVFGLRISAASSYTDGAPIGCMIDGVAYPVNTAKPTPPAGTVSGNVPPGLNNILIATDLGDGPHYVELVLPAFLSGATRSYGLLGYLVDSRAGYVAPPRGLDVTLPRVTCTTSFVGLLGLTSPVYSIRKLFFFNSDVSTRIVSIQDSTTTGTFWQKQIAAGDTVEFDPGGYVYDSLSVKADAAAVVICTIMGGC